MFCSEYASLPLKLNLQRNYFTVSIPEKKRREQSNYSVWQAAIFPCQATQKAEAVWLSLFIILAVTQLTLDFMHTCC